MVDNNTAADPTAAKDPDDWTTGDEPMTGAQKSYLQEHVAAFERMMSSSAWNEPRHPCDRAGIARARRSPAGVCPGR